MNGVIVVDKPRGWTSHDVVGKMRRICGTKRIGHLGTLDPMATGVLPLLIEKATRLAQYFGHNEKEYEGTIRYGWATNTYDAEGEQVGAQTQVSLTPEQAEQALAAFRGPILQTPPPVSAKKVNGRPAYELARKNIAVELKPVEVTVHELEVLGVEGNEVRVRVRASAGTYIRSIAHDSGKALGCGGHLCGLRRIRSGPFAIEKAWTLEQLAELAATARLEEALLPASELLPEIPLEVIDQTTETQIRQGRDFRVSPFTPRGESRLVKAVNRDGQLVAIGEARLPHVYHPVMVL